MRQIIFDASGKMIEHTLDGISQPLVVQAGAGISNIKHKWPLILQPMKLLAQPGDKGLGDILARKIGPIGGDAFKAWYKATFGKSCGCDPRQESWNKKYPL